MNILVCISNVPDTTSKINFTDSDSKFDKSGIQFIINPNDEFGLTKAVWMKESNNASVTALTVGDASSEAILRKCLAIGADKAIRIDCEALDAYSEKSSKDDINKQLEAFLYGLSDQELQQFKTSKDFSELVKAIKTMKVKDSALNNFEDIKNIEDHIITSMIKRFFDNA